MALISCTSSHADTQKVFSSKLLYEHNRDMLDKDWKMEFIRSRNNQAERYPCITDHLFNLCIKMSTKRKVHSIIWDSSLHEITLDKIIRHCIQNPLKQRCKRLWFGFYLSCGDPCLCVMEVRVPGDGDHFLCPLPSLTP